MIPYLVLYVAADKQIKVQAVGAPTPTDALHAVVSELASKGQEDALIVGVLTEEDVAGMSQVMTDLRTRINEADPQE